MESAVFDYYSNVTPKAVEWLWYPYDDRMKRTIGHRFNMFIMKKEKFDEYCIYNLA